LVLVSPIVKAEPSRVVTNYFTNAVITANSFTNAGDTGLSVSNSYVCFKVAELPQLTDSQASNDVGAVMHSLCDYLYDQIQALASSNRPVYFTVSENIQAQTDGTLRKSHNVSIYKTPTGYSYTSE